MKNYYIGIMSGTSMDGIDAVLAEINRIPVGFVSHDIQRKIKEQEDRVNKCSKITAPFSLYSSSLKVRLSLG